ncbi:serine hydrolase [Novosphingobium sp. G106]|uniref:serine hydrolase n=1 Tax=Novosphingobium sp. G106 TaxID=2849500 RepID=UPI001C2DE462|nr:serine hydrolase [Novosphingobium sp. G106]MBV1687241.1 serine hydrolase [Novosphingobium sp. G106]
MKRLLFAALLALVSAPAGAATPDKPSQRAAEVVEALKAGQAPDSLFAPSFLAAVPPAQIARIVQQLEAQAGKLLGVQDIQVDTPTTARFVLRFERALATATLTIEPDGAGRVTGLRITSVTPLGDSLEKIRADFAALPGRSGFAVIKLEDRGPFVPILESHSGEQFAIGSAFKLWVLDALAEEIAAGRHRWDEVVPLGPRSLPSGMTQEWPAQAPVTIETLATLMISISDNTATDTLIRLIGRERLAERVRATGHSAPSRILPFMTTAESFALKLSPPAERDAYAKASDAAQEQRLAALDARKILDSADIAALGAKPTAIDSIEWFASPEDIARVLDSLRRRPDPRVLQILGIVPAVSNEVRQRLAYVGYKGGSEVGVINLTWLLRRKSGSWMVITLSWNNTASAVDADRFGYLAQRLLRLGALEQ